ncbi:MAG: 50S ribosomal protein L11 methyltransferase [Alphaproteobacteria bacterium]|jgi:ribosomal protein L11 methyltransferase|nr:50S ribosomal protein L11 methyltransferase [Alphaproteobacteria bacterium]MBT7943820.1 50S ribosomal protein L11 methyltransferase [Alphaproteobacteria bacterium]
MRSSAPAPTFLWRIEARVPDAAMDAFEVALEPFCMAISTLRMDPDIEDGLWSIEGFTGAEPDPQAIKRAFAKAAGQAGIDSPRPKIDLVPPRDWVAENLADFPPVLIGRYFIHGSHFDGTPPAGSKTILLDSGTAFGSGEHPSTAGCLTVLDQLARHRHFRRPLDMGCGSGILSLAIAKTWRVPVVSCDIDPESARVTTVNAARNGVTRLVRAVAGPSYQTPIVAQGRPFDLIVANILARPLQKMAGDLAHVLAPGGVAVLSGLLRRDARLVINPHRAHGLKLVRTHSIGDWVTFVMEG